MSEGSQKFIARNRAPRVQIEYDVELYGAEKKVQLPFVMGVMSDLAGKSQVEQPAVKDRKFLEIDVDNFDERMRAMKPRTAFSVPNTLTGEGNIEIDLTFEAMDDFTPGAIAAKVDSLRPLLEARTQLTNLMAYMDGKAGAEDLIEKILASPSLLSSLGTAGPVADQSAVLNGLRDMAPAEVETPDDQADALAALRAVDVPEAPAEPEVGDILSTIPEAPAEPEAADTVSDTLSSLADAAPTPEEATDTHADALSSLPEVAPEEEAPDTTGDTLAGLAAAAPEEAPAEDPHAALDSLPEVAPEEEAPDTTGDTLAGLAAAAPEEAPAEDPLAALDSLPEVAPEEEAPDTTGEMLADLAAAAPEETPAEDPLAALDSLPEVAPEEEAPDTTGEMLANLAAAAPEEAPVEDPLAALDSLPEVAPAEEAPDTTGDTLAGLAAAAPEEAPAEDPLAALDSLPEVAPEEEAPDTTGDTLAGLAAAAPEEAPAEDPLAALDSLPEVSPEEEAPDTTGEMLADLAAAAPEETPAEDPLAALDSLPEVAPEEAAPDTTGEMLADLAAAAPEEAPAEDPLAALDSLPEVAPEEEAPDTTGDTLAGLAAAVPEEAPAEDPLAALDSLPEVAPAEEAPDTTGEMLADLAAAAPEEAPAEDPLAALDSLPEVAPAPEQGDAAQAALDDLAAAPVAETPGDDMGLDDLLGDLAAAPQPTAPAEPEAGGDLDDLLGDLGAADMAPPVPTAEAEPPAAPVEAPLTEETGDLDDLLGDLGAPEPADATPAPEPAGDDLDDLLGDLTPAAEETPPEPEPVTSDLDDLLGDLGAPEPAEAAPAPEPAGDDLDDLLGDLTPAAEETQPAAAEAPTSDLDDLLGDLADLDESPAPAAETPAAEVAAASVETAAAPAENAVAASEAKHDSYSLSFGTVASERPTAKLADRKRFRLAIMGDFSGRAAKGLIDTGDALAARKAILLDPDTVEDVISSFKTKLVLPLGKDGAGIEVELNELDDLHPDELFENVELFSELVSLKQQLSSGTTAEHAAKTLQAWGEAHGTPIKPPALKSAGNSVPTDRKLSDFQKLIGDTSGALTEAGPIDDLLARVVGPYIRAIPDPNTVAMQEAVDQALSVAMRLLLHHPEFQSIESQWRTLDLIARSVEADNTLDVMLYDISAEEMAADLATAEDLGQSGLVRLLTEEPLDEENGRGGYSALIGLYTFEETPPHAELLGRIARVAAHLDAPFVAAQSVATLDVEKEDRHPLTASAWDALRDMPEAAWLGLATPRFMLRRPYGAKTEPCYEFDFEEFTMQEGLRGLLWANPAVLVAILMARSFKQNGKAMNLGSVMSQGDMPYHYVEDRYGDQVALPCTERNLTLERVEKVMTRGLMPIVSIKGRDEIRLASFQSYAGGELRGPWSGMPPPPPSPAPEPVKPAQPAAGDAGAVDLDSELDDLLATFDEPGDGDTSGSEDIDADLAALLEDL